MFKPQEINNLSKLVRDSGNALMRYYQKATQNTQLKADFSPVTEADKLANEMICNYLTKNFSSFPIISEEAETIPFSTRKEWNTHWLVDPLDGTKEFIAGINEFTVNIALIQNKVPIMGFVGIPGTGDVYVGELGKGAYLENNELEKKEIKVRAANKLAPTFVISRSHGSGESDSIKAAFPNAKLMQVGSSLKFLKIAEGVADMYFRHQGICEWDTAAGHAVLIAAGGRVIDHSGQDIVYGGETLRVMPFIALGDQAISWKKLV